MSHDEKRTEKMKRFDDAFRMLLIVMTVTTSIGLSTYEGLSLQFALAYLVMSLIFWVAGHLLGSNPIFGGVEIGLKINAWITAFLVTTSTLAKFALRVPVLDLGPKIFIFIVAGALAFATYSWFESYLLPEARRRYMKATLTIIFFLLGGSLGL